MRCPRSWLPSPGSGAASGGNRPQGEIENRVKVRSLFTPECLQHRRALGKHDQKGQTPQMVNRRSQMGFDEEPLSDPELERLLDQRESAKEELEPYRLNYKGLNDQVKAKIEERELPEGTYRAGDFIIKISTSEPREVSFERPSARRISIKPAKV